MISRFFLLQKQKEHDLEHNEAQSASHSMKASVTGQIQQKDFRDFYEKSRGKALGTGMTGAVHEWRHRVTRQQVAIKTVPKKGMRASALRDMRQEIALLAQLDHPNIVKILEAYEDQTAITLVMEICSGGELFDNLISETFYTQQVRFLHIYRPTKIVLFCCKESRIDTWRKH